MAPNVPSRVRRSEEECLSPNFRLPPRHSAPPIIRFQLFMWELLEFVEGTPREILLSCSMCAYQRTTTWAINTSNFVSHLKLNHRSKLVELTKVGEEAVREGEDKKNTILATNLACYNDDDTPQSDNSFTINSSLKRRRGSRDQPSHVLFDESRARRFIMDYILDCNVLFRSVGRETFTRMLSYFRTEKYSISRTTFRREIDAFYNEAVQNSKEMLAKVKGRLCLTLDEWKSSNNIDFLGITIHYHDDQFMLVEFTIGFEQLNKALSYTGELLYEHLQRVLTAYGIQERILSITRDNGSNVEVLVKTFAEACRNKGMRFNGNIRCAGHVLNLSTEDFFHFTFFRAHNTNDFRATMREVRARNPDFADVYNTAEDLPEIVRNIITLFNKSVYFRNSLRRLIGARRLEENSILGPEVLLRDNQTRWLSTYKMLERFILFRAEVTEILNQPETPRRIILENFRVGSSHIEDCDWDYLARICSILQIYESATLRLQASDYETSNLTIMSVFRLLMKLDERIEDNQEAKNALILTGLLLAKEKLLKYYPVYDPRDETLQPLYMACVLDPRQKLRVFLRLPGFPLETISKIENHVRATYRRYKKELEDEQRISKDSNSTQERRSRRKASANSSNEDVEDDLFFSDDQGDSEDEVLRYLSAACSRRETRVHDFYNENKSAYPVLFRMAKDFLAIPAMSAPLERLFSQVGDIVTKKRNRLLPGTIQKLAILKSQGPIEGERQDEGIVAEENITCSVVQETELEFRRLSIQSEGAGGVEIDEGT